jgi:arylsulfatase
LPGCLADIAVEAAERHTVQYFETFGSRATYSGDWWACTRLDKAPWGFSPQTISTFAPGVYDPDKDVWELRSALR